MLVPVVVAACVLWVAVLSFLNVKERRDEIGLLRVLGVKTRGVIMMFLNRVVLLGLAGAAVGVAAAAVAASALAKLPPGAAVRNMLPSVSVCSALDFSDWKQELME